MHISSQSPRSRLGCPLRCLLNQGYCGKRSKIHGGRRRMEGNRQRSITVGLWRSDLKSSADDMSLHGCQSGTGCTDSFAGQSRQFSPAVWLLEPAGTEQIFSWFFSAKSNLCWVWNVTAAVICKHPQMCNTPSWFSAWVKGTGAISGTKFLRSCHFGGSFLEPAQHVPE